MGQTRSLEGMTSTMTNSDLTGPRDRLDTSTGPAEMVRLDRLGVDLSRLPKTVLILLENLLRRAGTRDVSDDDVRALAAWPGPARDVAFMPGRVLMQDFTGVPAVVDLAAMRSATQRAGGDPTSINPLIPVDLVIDHSVQVDLFRTPEAYERNIEFEYRRNAERYTLLRWAQQAFDGLRVVPPGAGICHQVNLEHLGQVVSVHDGVAFPDTVVGTDSHTTMINGLGVLGWGVGGIEAEAAMLGQPMFLPQPVVIGVRMLGALPAGTTATDLVLTLTEMLRAHGVVGRFVEFFGDGLSSLSIADRATLSNMCPEYGATASYFPIDDETLRYLRFTGREDRRRAGRALREGAGTVPRRRRPGADVQRDPRPGPGCGGAVHGRTEASSGPGCLAGRLGLVRGRVPRSRGTRSATHRGGPVRLRRWQPGRRGEHRRDHRPRSLPARPAGRGQRRATAPW